MKANSENDESANDFNCYGCPERGGAHGALSVDRDHWFVALIRSGLGWWAKPQTDATVDKPTS